VGEEDPQMEDLVSDTKGRKELSNGRVRVGRESGKMILE
jgi:hypothetical protein